MTFRITDHRSPMGFTMIELLVVIAIIAALAATIRPMLSASASRTREFQCESNLKQLAVGMRAYVSDYGAFPARLVDVDSILQDKSLLSCPSRGRRYWYKEPAAGIHPHYTIAACVKPGTRKPHLPHRFGRCTLILTAGGSVRRVVVNGQ